MRNAQGSRGGGKHSVDSPEGLSHLAACSMQNECNGNRLASGGGILRPDDPDIAGRGRHSAKKNVVLEVAGLGAGARNEAPTDAVPVQQQRRLILGAAGGEVRAKSPYIVR